eukprot:6048491-Ditylum_brightwellii.AAC.1
MAAGYKQGIFDRGVFIPYGICIKEGPEFLKNLLGEHNSYVKDIKCLAVEGNSVEAMFSPSPVPGFNNAIISDHFGFETHSIEAVEPTQLTEEKGKWFILYK